MKALITASRVRSILAGACTEIEAARILRAHRIRYSYSTAGGVFHIRIPARSGVVSVVRTAGRSAPLAIVSGGPEGPVPYPFPVPCYSWDD